MKNTIFNKEGNKLINYLQNISNIEIKNKDLFEETSNPVYSITVKIGEKEMCVTATYNSVLDRVVVNSITFPNIKNLSKRDFGWDPDNIITEHINKKGEYFIKCSYFTDEHLEESEDYDNFPADEEYEYDLSVFKEHIDYIQNNFKCFSSWNK